MQEIINGVGGGNDGDGGGGKSGAKWVNKKHIWDMGNYCWLYGFLVLEEHTSMTCSKDKEGHKDNAIRNNIMGGFQFKNHVHDRGREETKIEKCLNFNLLKETEHQQLGLPPIKRRKNDAISDSETTIHCVSPTGETKTNGSIL